MLAHICAIQCFLVFLSLATEVTCYSSGAPSDGCWSERPFHDDNLPSHTCAPYVIELEKDGSQDVYTARDVIRVRIRSVDGSPFRGYLMKVTGSSGATQGRWAAHKTTQKYLSTCGVTHANATDQTDVSVIWQAPKDTIMGTIQFKAIVVKNYTTFYQNVLSRPLKPHYPVDKVKDLFERLLAFTKMDWNATVVQLPVVPGPAVQNHPSPLLLPPPEASREKGNPEVAGK